MASRVKDIGRRGKREQTLPLATRFLLVILIWSIQSLYIPTSNRIFGGIEPKLPIDIFPIWAIWVVPYVLCYPLWVFGTLWAIFQMEDRMFRSLIAAFLLTCTIAVSIFIFFPTYVRADRFQSHDVFTSLLLFFHEHDGRYDAFPSGHIYVTVLLALFYNLWYPRYKFFWISIPTIVAFSTLFTHQHLILDIVGGIAVALIGFHFGLRWAGISLLPNRANKSYPLQPHS